MSNVPTTRRTETPSSAIAMREIDAVFRAPALHWVGDGFRVHGYFSAIPDAVRKLDPFLMLDYHPAYDYAPTTERRGVGVHPHRGFETVTIAFQGSVAHHDSAGGGGVIGPGDVQWMTAASGILHKEYHEEAYGLRGGPFQMAQLWVNLPRAHKMDAPRYQPILAEQVASVALDEGAGTVRVIAGEFQGVRGPAKTFSPVTILDARVNAGGRLELHVPASETAAFLVMKGEIVVQGDTAAHEGEFVLFAREGERIVVDAKTDVQLLVLGGEPLGEPIVQYGPFVMNTKQEIVQAITDFGNGKFGHLDD